MDRVNLFFGWILTVLLLTACDEPVSNARQMDLLPPLSTDYAGVTIPATIAPLNFTLTTSFLKINATIKGEKGGLIKVQGKEQVSIPQKEWQELLHANKGGELTVTVAAKQEDGWIQYVPFSLYISEYPIDYGLVYRLIAPGYELYSKMGIYQRKLVDFTQTALLENTLIPGSCVNCHSFKETDPGSMSLHIRGEYGGTLLQTDERSELLNLKTDGLISGGVYPYWHPSGKYIAYSVNTTQQVFHSVQDERVEVVDLASDIVVYDVETNRMLTTPLLSSGDFETFPAFSPDGRSLYFCCSARQQMPNDYKEARYNLCRIGFDPESKQFGEKIDTLIHAEAMGKSVSFPRPSYDGRYLMYTLSDYGNFSIWHKEADLWLMDMETLESRALVEVNSSDTESYHSWSSNSRWFVFSSRRGDGLYTRLYLASIDEGGHVTKPFLLPQQKVEKYDPLLFSYNIPEFISGPVQIDVRSVEQQALSKIRKQADK